jgi:hypothetical protein
MYGVNIDVIMGPVAMLSSMARTPAMKPTSDDVEAFLDAFPSETHRADAHQLSTLMAQGDG